MLQADSASQKTAMRERIDAVSMSDFEMQSTFSILGFNAVLSPIPMIYQFLFPTILEQKRQVDLTNFKLADL